MLGININVFKIIKIQYFLLLRQSKQKRRLQPSAKPRPKHIPQFLIWFFYIPWYAIFYNPFDQEWRIEKNIEFNSCLHNIFFQSSTHDPNHSKLKRFFYSMLCFFAFSKNTKASLQHFLYGTIIRKKPNI